MTPIHTLQRSWKIVLGFAALGLAVSGIATFVQPLRYGATARLLVIQRASYGVDPFTAVKSAERVAENLAQVISTTDFFTKVIEQDATINTNYFSNRADVARRQWRRMARTSVAPGTGLLAVTILQPDPTEATKISQAVAQVLTGRGREYVGGDIEIKLVDAPLASRFPVAPNIPVNLASGIVLGLLVGAVLSLRRGAA